MVTNFRNLENRDGKEFDANKTKVLFAEDYNAHSEVINGIEDYLSSGVLVKSGHIQLSPSQVQNILSSPVVLIPAPESNQMILVLSVFTSLTFNSVAYGGNNHLYFCYGNTPLIPIFSTQAFLNTSVSKKLLCGRIDSSEENAGFGQSFVVSTNYPNPNNGDSPIDIYFTYIIV